MTTGYFGDLSAIFGGNATSDQYGGAIAGTTALGGGALSIFGTLQASSAAKTEAGISLQEAQTEKQMNDVRRQMMVIDNNRKQIQAARDVEIAKSRGKAAAVNQGGSVIGSSASSGYSGGQAQETAQGAYNAFNLTQDLAVGNQMFDLTSQLDTEKIAMSQAQSAQASGAGLASIGGAALNVAGTLGKLLMV